MNSICVPSTEGEMLTTSSSDTDLSAARISPEVFNFFSFFYSLGYIKDTNSDFFMVWFNNKEEERRRKKVESRESSAQNQKQCQV